MRKEYVFNIILTILVLLIIPILIVNAQTGSKGVIKVGNIGPSISSVLVTSDATGVISSSTNPTNETIYVNFSVTWSDPNSDPVSVYVCKTNAANSAGCTGGTWTSSSSSSVNPRILQYTTLVTDLESNPAYVFVSDGAIPSSEAAGDQTFKVNHAPYATAVIIGPGSPVEASTLTCTYTFNDDDIDGVADTERVSDALFEWYLKDEGIGSFTIIGGESSSTLSNTNFDKNDVLNCRVRVTDNHGWPDDVFVNSTNFVTIGNTAPNPPTAILVQDGGTPDFDDNTIGHDGTGGYDTHMLQPEIRWTEGTDVDLDSISTYVCLATIGGGCDLESTLTAGTSYTVSPGLLDYLGTSRTYYLLFTSFDGIANSSSTGIIFNVTNDQPTAPSAISPTATHDSTPLIDYADSIDPDTAGTIDNYPADTLTYFYTAGTFPGGNNLVDNVSSGTSQYQHISAIPWGIDGQAQGWNNETVYVSIYAADGHNGGTSTTYNDLFVLYDYLPNIVSMEITNSLSLYSDQAVDPIANSDAAVAIKMRATDTDGDCASGHIAWAMLCDTTITTCDETTSQYYFSLDKVSVGPGDDCYYEITGNATTGTPEFWKDAGIWNIHGNITEDISVGSGNERTTDPENTGTFIYNELNAVNYPTLILLGGDPIILGSFNTNTTAAVMENWGNIHLDLNWRVTDAISDNDYWNLSVEGDDDFIIDDDTTVASDLGNIAEVFLIYTDRQFNPANGLENCDSDLCNNPALNETLNTYYHVRPPLGLLPGLYNTTITITRTKH